MEFSVGVLTRIELEFILVLDLKGNSVVGIQILQKFSKRLYLSIF